MKQNAKIKKFGSFNNWMMANNSTEPVAGQGATTLYHTDRYPYEVLEVSNDKKTCIVRPMKAERDRTKNNDMGHQNWVLSSDEDNATEKWVYRNGAWRVEIVNIVFDKNFSKDKTVGEQWTIARHMDIFDDNGQMMYVKGITKEKKRYPVVNVVFGHAEKYYDWSF